MLWGGKYAGRRGSPRSPRTWNQAYSAVWAVSAVACGPTPTGGMEDGTSSTSSTSGGSADVLGDVAGLDCPATQEIEPTFELILAAALVPEIDVAYEYGCVVNFADAASGDIELVCDGHDVAVSVPSNSYDSQYLAPGNLVDFGVARAADETYWFEIADDEGPVVGGAGGTDWAQLLPSHPSVLSMLNPVDVRLHEETDCPKYLVWDNPDCPVWGRRIALEARANKNAEWLLVYDESVGDVENYRVWVEAHSWFTEPHCVVSDYPAIRLRFLVGRGS